MNPQSMKVRIEARATDPATAATQRIATNVAAPFFTRILAECARQLAIFGEQDHLSRAEFGSAFAEEAGAVTKAVNETHFSDEDPVGVLREVVQTAAVGLALAQHLANTAGEIIETTDLRTSEPQQPADVDLARVPGIIACVPESVAAYSRKRPGTIEAQIRRLDAFLQDRADRLSRSRWRNPVDEAIELLGGTIYRPNPGEDVETGYSRLAVFLLTAFPSECRFVDGGPCVAAELLIREGRQLATGGGA